MRVLHEISLGTYLFPRVCVLNIPLRSHCMKCSVCFVHCATSHVQWESYSQLLSLESHLLSDCSRMMPPDAPLPPLSLHLSKLAFVWEHKTLQLYLFKSVTFLLSEFFLLICIHASLVDRNSLLFFMGFFVLVYVSRKHERNFVVLLMLYLKSKKS